MGLGRGNSVDRLAWPTCTGTGRRGIPCRLALLELHWRTHHSSAATAPWRIARGTALLGHHEHLRGSTVSKPMRTRAREDQRHGLSAVRANMLGEVDLGTRRGDPRMREGYGSYSRGSDGADGLRWSRGESHEGDCWGKDGSLRVCSTALSLRMLPWLGCSMPLLSCTE